MAKTKAPKTKSDVWTPRRWSKEFLSAIPWNDEQLAIFEEVQNGEGNLLISAAAGSGKSTTLKGIIGLLPPTTKINVLMYNRSVKDAFRNDPRIPTRVGVSTAHQFCQGLLIGKLGKDLTLDEKKADKLADWGVSLLKHACADYSYRLQNKQPTKEDYPMPPPMLPEDSKKREIALQRFHDELEKLINFARLNLTEPSESKTMVDALEFVVGYFAIRFPMGERAKQWGIKLAIDLLERCFQQAIYDHIIDYTDMVWLVHKLRLAPQKPKAESKVLLVDESQDAPRCFISLYKKFERAGYRCIFVGDEYQSIAGYTGALPTAMEQIETYFDAKRLPLAETQRCPKTHVALASLINPHIRAREDAIAGNCSLLHPNAVRKVAQTGDLVICRFNAPLIKLCLETRFFEGKAGVVRGKDVAKDMVNFAKSIEKHCTWKEFKQTLLDQRDYVVGKQIEAEQIREADATMDRYIGLQYCYEYLGKNAGSFDQFVDAITEAFPNEAEDRTRHIIFSSIHSAKGDEAENVFIIGANILPYFRQDMLKWMFSQEIFLTHVALTRSKANLIFVPTGRTEEEVQEWLTKPAAGLKLEYFEHYKGEGE